MACGAGGDPQADAPLTEDPVVEAEDDTAGEAADGAAADEAADDEAADDGAADAAVPADGGFDPKALPEDFPDAIPLPDDYLVVGDGSGDYDDVGRSIELNIAIGGTLDEARARYGEVLEAAFEDVTPPEDPLDENLPWRFSGQGFEQGALYVSENHGAMDRGRVDSTHLDTQLSIILREQARE